MKWIFCKLFLSLSLILYFSLLPCNAVRIHPNAGTTSASFLKLGIGSRATSMGCAFCGIADDSTALYWNPAGLAQINWQEVHITHNESFESIRHDFLGYVHPLPKGDVIAAAIYGLYTPKDIERRAGLNEADPYEPITPIEGFFQAYDLAAHVSYARYIRKNLSAGASFKLIQQVIDNSSAYGAALDFGLLYCFESRPLSIGFTIQHLGTPIQFISKSYPLPINFKLGASYKWNKKIRTTLDFNKSIDNFLFISAGSEYDLLNLLSFRVGYKYRIEGLELGDLSGLSTGIGLNFKLNNLKFKLDYAFIPFGVLGDSHRISTTVLFGKPFQNNKMVRAIKPPSKNNENIQTAEATLPPQPEIILALQENNTGYIFYPAKTSSKLKMATGRMSVFLIQFESDKSEVTFIEGAYRGQNPKNLNLEIGEKTGQENIYKYFTFKTNFNNQIQKLNLKIKLPKSLENPIIETDDSLTITAQKISEENEYIYYQFNMDNLKPFRIEFK